MRLTRRQFVQAPSAFRLQTSKVRRPPNILLIVSDDQGFGDLSLHGNTQLATPNLDSIGRDGVQFTQFQVCPVCSPTRSSLMTGRYNYRTGVVDTYLGRSMMYPDEVTLPEYLGRAGYQTGIFGKWHLGDNYPLRSVDQGFHESVVCKGGGVGQPSDPPGNSYFDPTLQHNGKPQPYQGYCTDIFFNEAMRWIERRRRDRFFCYVATNAPHDPLTVSDRYVQPFRDKGLDDATAKTYGMVANLDENVGRMLQFLNKQSLDRNTLVVFLTDNGPQRPRYNAAMRGIKGTVYQGGIRVPSFWRWPGHLKPGTKINRIAAHIDVTPTLLDLCGVKPDAPHMDGRSLSPLFRGDEVDWPDRTLFTQWHRGDEPQLFRACAARNQRYKLVDGKELYDLSSDPAEQHDVSAERPEIAGKLRRQTEAWFRDVSSTRGYAPPRIAIGAPEENPVILTRQDWRGPRATWDAKGLGHWEVHVASAAAYQVTLRIPQAPQAGDANFRLASASASKKIEQGANSIEFPPMTLPAGPGTVEAALPAPGQPIGPHYVEIRKL
ncbi:MAG: arylsulfatase [Bryobacterales bacterium]|nr:arylsulfatase [Bryobacterales bacterium]